MEMYTSLRVSWVILALSLVTTGAFAQKNPLFSSQENEVFPIEAEMSPLEWQTFLGANEAERRNLWHAQTSKGRQLEDWNWTWRLAWVRVCAQSSEAYCGEIVRQALTDKALVVRAEAIARLGERFQNTGNQYPHVIAALEVAYKHPGNMRNGKPLYIQKRILNALARIMGDQGSQRLQDMAKAHASTYDYWMKMTNRKEKL